MQAIIDHRETKLKDIITDAEISKYNISFENLDIGDIAVYASGVLVCIFERKSYNDLKASIIDGRYRNQKNKLVQTHGAPKTYYLMEFSLMNHQNMEKMVVGALINTQLRDKIGVFRTCNVTDTWRLVCEIMDRIAEDPGKYMGTEPATGLPEIPHGGNKREPAYINMLCQVPSISVKTAKAIAAKYPSLVILIDALRGKSEKDQVLEFKDVYVNGKHINSTSVKKLINALHETLSFHHSNL